MEMKMELIEKVEVTMKMEEKIEATMDNSEEVTCLVRVRFFAVCVGLKLHSLS